MYKFPHISCGYVGKVNKNSTITAEFFAMYWQYSELISQEIIFPQRIPKIGYFQELCELETKIFSSDLKNTINTINQYTKRYLTDNSTSIINPRAIITLIRLMLRYSLFDDVISIVIPNNVKPDIAIEVNFLQAIARLEIQLSQGVGQLSLEELIQLTAKVNQIENIRPEFELTLFNKIVVYFYRHKAQATNGEVMHLLNKYINQLSKFSGVDFSSNILRSICYRGVAMADELGLSKQEEFLNLAENYARTIRYNNELERLITIDNLCTCLLSLAKWNIQQENYTKAEALLSEICKLDPFDSVGYCEMGLLLYRLNRFSEAIKYFENATLLGPPGVGMSTYFQAKCFEKMSLSNEFVSALHKASEIDKNAVSPLLDLFDFYKMEFLSKAKDIAKKILSSAVLREQLTQQEINALESVHYNNE
jgi:tetratricopeptide (TPR) repeat protein